MTEGKVTAFNCPFCTATISQSAFLQSERFLAICNIAPALPGHALVIPKEHISSFLDLSGKDVAEFVGLSQDVAKVLSRTYMTKAFDWSIQEGEDAGQSIAHLHLHVVPRVRNDLPNPGDWHGLIRTSERHLLDSEIRPQMSAAEISRNVKDLRRIAIELGSDLHIGRP